MYEQRLKGGNWTPRIDDLVRPFVLEATGIRGRLVRLGPAADSIISRHGYSDEAATLLGELLALTAVLSSMLKFDGVFTAQTNSHGPVSMTVVDITSEGALRGYLHSNEEHLSKVVASNPPPHSVVPRLLGSGHLAFTIDQGDRTDRYQGIVELTGSTIADCAHHYFRQSEQLEVAIKLAAGKTERSNGGGPWRAGGLIIQRMPDEEYGELLDAEEADDRWRRSLALMSSCTSRELLLPDLSPDDLLYRLFHEDRVRVFDIKPLVADCRCSRDRVQRLIRSLSRAELEEMKLDDAVIVTCQFCNASFSFGDADLDAVGAEWYDKAPTSLV